RASRYRAPIFANLLQHPLQHPLFVLKFSDFAERAADFSHQEFIDRVANGRRGRARRRAARLLGGPSFGAGIRNEPLHTTTVSVFAALVTAVYSQRARSSRKTALSSNSTMLFHCDPCDLWTVS